MLHKLFEDYLKEKLYLKNVSQATIRSYRQAFDRFSKSGVRELSRQTLSDFVVWMRERNLSPVTCNISIRSLNSFLSWLYESGQIREPLKIKQLKTEKKAIKAYDDKELQRILMWKPRTFVEWRLYALLATLIDTGCRIDEILKLTRANVDFDNLVITVTGKGNKSRIVPFSLELRKHLFKFLQRHSFDLVFASRQGSKADYRTLLKQWKCLCKSLGIEYRGFHSLRHNFGLNFIRQGGDISELRRLLGHTSIVTTQMYVNLQVEDLKRAHAKTSILSRLK